ncbi:hypothetical protein AVEN_60138-1 [Araneus ventricosus]|uniref:Uncharacterized protein n=1 Tax=Araneus ventricosus TaxID=182803 RepID=A0A4Y2HYA4_ARAVE|nr:hypothetical protein AVEN_60138-1 [Araneus ventricosus]
MLECIDRFQQEINTRCEGMECISNRFAVLEPSNLIETSETELPKFVQSSVVNYNYLSEVYRNFTPKKMSKNHQVPKEESLGWTSLRFLEFVVEYELFDSVPNLP